MALISRIRATYQIGFGILISVALVVQLIYGIYVSGGAAGEYVVQFISYFTILSNILVAVVLFLEARASLKGQPLSARFARVRSTAVFCILITGIIYSFFLRGPGVQGAVQDSIPWVNAVFHYIMPTVMTLEWLIFPSRTKTRWFMLFYWIAITIVYLIYVELLGIVTGTYPYFFLDPTKLHGYLGVLRASIFFVPFFVFFGGLLIITNRLRLRFSK